MDSYFGNTIPPHSIARYGNKHFIFYDRFRNVMFSVNTTLSFLLTNYLSNIYFSVLVIYLLLLMDAFLAFIICFKSYYTDHSFWCSIKQTILHFQWARFFNGTILKAIVFPTLLLIFYVLSRLFGEEIIYEIPLILLISSETKSLDKHLYALFRISLYEKLTAALLKGPLSFMNVNPNNINAGTSNTSNTTSTNNIPSSNIQSNTSSKGTNTSEKPNSPEGEPDK